MQTGTYIYVSGFAILGKENPWIQMYYDLYRWTIGFAGSVFVLSGINLLMNVTVNKFKTAKNLVGGGGNALYGNLCSTGICFSVCHNTSLRNSRSRCSFYIGNCWGAVDFGHLLWNNAFFKKDKTIKHLLIRWKIEYFIEEFAYMIFKHVCSHSYNGYNPPRLRHVMQIQINLILLVNME